MSATTISEERQARLDELTEAAQRLAQSDKGRHTLSVIHRWLTDSGLSLDGDNKDAVLILIEAAFTDSPGSAREAMVRALGRR